MQGTVVSVSVGEGDLIAEGRPVLVLEAMKMEHDVRAPASGTVVKIAVASGDTVDEGQRLAVIERSEVAASAAVEAGAADPDAIRPDLAEALARHEKTLDAARPEAVERRRKTGQR